MDTQVQKISHRPAGRKPKGTIDPTQIQSSSGIPPSGAQYAGLSAQKQVDVYYGTLKGDIDAKPAAQELLSTAPDTGGLSNADYAYNNLSKLFGGINLPAFQSPNKNSVRSLLFVSGSRQGPFGAFHIQDSDQAHFDRIVSDSLNASGNYSPGSGLSSKAKSSGSKNMSPVPLSMYKGEGNLLDVTSTNDPRLKAATKKDLLSVLPIANQSARALKAALKTGNFSAIPAKRATTVNQTLTKKELSERLIRANKNTQKLLNAVAQASPGRQYLSTALFIAELTESLEAQANNSLPGQTDGEGLSRIAAFKLTPEIALVPGFNSAVSQQWWKDGHPDWVNDNSQSDQSTDGNAAGVMFLQYLNDYLGIPLDDVVKNMPQGGGPLGQTYANLVKEHPELAQAAGQDGKAAFQSMISLLQKNAQNSDGTLNLPANGNPYVAMAGSKQGGLFSGQVKKASAA